MPSITQLLPNRKVLCLRVLSTASRKMPPKATFAPRLWHSVSSTTTRTRTPGTNWCSRAVSIRRITSSQFHTAWENSRNDEA